MNLKITFMKFLYPDHKSNVSFITAALIALFTLAGITATAQQTTVPELSFINPKLEPHSVSDGKDGAIYRFSNVQAGIDALVTINGRSSTLVKLENIDLTGTGWDKAFQPQVSYNSGKTKGAADWWMEFQITFVKTGTTTATSVSSFNVTGLDIDGDGDKLAEYLNFYNQKSYTLEKNSKITVSSLLDDLLGGLLGLLTPTAGKKFTGTTTDYSGVDTSITSIMATNTYANTNSFTVRTGAHTSDATDEASRMYALYFKSFSYTAPTVSFLPVTLIDWNATYANNTVSLKWTTTVEQNSSHFIIERSTDGSDYTDAAMIVAAGNSETLINYSYNDKIPAGNSGILYYRLRSVDMDGTSKVSDVRVVRIGTVASNTVKIMTYPNPVISDLRITVPQNWQDKSVTYQLVNTNGQTIKTYSTSHASQTEVISMAQVPSGMYFIKVTCGTETGVQSIMK
jgi:hypothetical protein